MSSSLCGIFHGPRVGLFMPRNVPFLQGCHKCSVHAWPRPRSAISKDSLVTCYCQTFDKTLSIKRIQGYSLTENSIQCESERDLISLDVLQCRQHSWSSRFKNASVKLKMVNPVALFVKHFVTFSSTQIRSFSSCFLLLCHNECKTIHIKMYETIFTQWFFFIQIKLILTWKVMHMDSF